MFKLTETETGVDNMAIVSSGTGCSIWTIVFDRSQYRCRSNVSVNAAMAPEIFLSFKSMDGVQNWVATKFPIVFN